MNFPNISKIFTYIINIFQYIINISKNLYNSFNPSSKTPETPPVQPQPKQEPTPPELETTSPNNISLKEPTQPEQETRSPSIPIAEPVQFPPLADFIKLKKDVQPLSSADFIKLKEEAKKRGGLNAIYKLFEQPYFKDFLYITRDEVIEIFDQNFNYTYFNKDHIEALLKKYDFSFYDIVLFSSPKSALKVQASSFCNLLTDKEWAEIIVKHIRDPEYKEALVNDSNPWNLQITIKSILKDAKDPDKTYIEKIFNEQPDIKQAIALSNQAKIIAKESVEPAPENESYTLKKLYQEAETNKDAALQLFQHPTLMTYLSQKEIFNIIFSYEDRDIQEFQQCLKQHKLTFIDLIGDNIEIAIKLQKINSAHPIFTTEDFLTIVEKFADCSKYVGSLGANCYLKEISLADIYEAAEKEGLGERLKAIFNNSRLKYALYTFLNEDLKAKYPATNVRQKKYRPIGIIGFFFEFDFDFGTGFKCQPSTSKFTEDTSPEAESLRAGIEDLVSKNKNIYEIIGLSESSNPSQSEIKKAYYKQARKKHPDRNKSSAATQKMVELNMVLEIFETPDALEYWKEAWNNRPPTAEYLSSRFQGIFSSKIANGVGA